MSEPVEKLQKLRTTRHKSYELDAADRRGDLLACAASRRQRKFVPERFSHRRENVYGAWNPQKDCEGMLTCYNTIPSLDIHVFFSPNSRVSVAATSLFHGMIGVSPENDLKTFAQAAIWEQKRSSLENHGVVSLDVKPSPMT